MKKLFIYLSLITLVVSCSKEFSSDEYGGYEMMTDYMLKEYTQGAALRQISKTGEYQAATPGTSVVNWVLEPHDAEMGGLTQNVEIYLQFNSGAEILYQTVNRSDMYDGPVGLPRFDFSLSLTQALGALGIGDIGTHFPNTEKWKDSEGEYLFKLTNEMILEKGYSLNQIDIIVILEKPKLNTFRKNIIASLKNITGLEESNIGFKAKTSEKMGFIGNNEGAACFVMAKLTK